MSTLEAALRGGAVFVLLLRVVVLAQNARRDQVSRYSALLMTGIAAYVVDSAPGFGGLSLGLRLPISVLNSGTAAAFWLTMGATFVDEFRARWYHALAWLVLTVLGPAAMVLRSPLLNAVFSALSLTCILLGIWHTVAGRATDLVEGRRRLRIVAGVTTALYTVLSFGLDRFWPGGLSAAPLSLANAIGLMALIFLFAVWRALPSSGESFLPAATPVGPARTPVDAPPKAPSPAGPDAALLGALRNLIDHDKVYREPDLSVASLSQKLEIPEYRLRLLINGQLGHRNFSAFVNGYRLAEAEAALADPAQTDVPILTIALDAGFGSIGPFNRAFKAQTGLTPTEYRRTRLDGARAEDTLPIPGIG